MAFLLSSCRPSCVIGRNLQLASCNLQQPIRLSRFEPQILSQSRIDGDSVWQARYVRDATRACLWVATALECRKTEMASFGWPAANQSCCHSEAGLPVIIQHLCNRYGRSYSRASCLTVRYALNLATEFLGAANFSSSFPRWPSSSHLSLLQCSVASRRLT